MHEIVESPYRRALDLLDEHREALEELGHSLLENEEITGEVVVRLLDGTGS